MHGPHIKKRTITSLDALAQDIAQQLSNQPGKAVVVCEHPRALASLISKKWQQLLRAILRELANTLDLQRRQQLTQKIEWMRSRTFSAAGSPEQLETSKTDVLFCTIEELLRYAPVCHAMYITHPIGQEELYEITVWMQPGDTVIRYHIVPRTKRNIIHSSVDHRLKFRTS